MELHGKEEGMELREERGGGIYVHPTIWFY